MGTTNKIEKALDEWEAEYKPIQNLINPDASWNGTMFETYGEELDFIQSQPNENIWTWNDSDEGTFLNAGYSIVNRLGYFITEKPWTDPCHVLQVDIDGETCDLCGEPTDNGAGHYQEELGNDDPRAEDRICKDCFWEIQTLEKGK